MDEKINEKNFLFSHTYNLEEEEIKEIILTTISKLDLKEEFKIRINVVKNKNNKKIGYSYIYIDNEKYFNALTGFNYDGSERINKIVKEKEEKEEKEEKKFLKDDWGDNIEDEEEYEYEYLPSLAEYPSVEINDKIKLFFYLNENSFDFNLLPSTLNLNYEKKNSLFSRNVPEWLVEKDFFNYFELYEKDKRLHVKKNSKFKYPQIFLKNNTVNVVFSNLHSNTASFVYNMERKVFFKKDDKQCLLFFNQNLKQY